MSSFLAVWPVEQWTLNKCFDEKKMKLLCTFNICQQKSLIRSIENMYIREKKSNRQSLNELPEKQLKVCSSNILDTF